jgi:hypothetical protein
MFCAKPTKIGAKHSWIKNNKFVNSELDDKTLDQLEPGTTYLVGLFGVNEPVVMTLDKIILGPALSETKSVTTYEFLSDNDTVRVTREDIKTIALYNENKNP